MLYLQKSAAPACGIDKDGHRSRRVMDTGAIVVIVVRYPRSGKPSPLKSPTAREFGLVPAAYTRRAVKGIRHSKIEMAIAVEIPHGDTARQR